MSGAYLFSRFGWGLPYAWFPFATRFLIDRDVIGARFFRRYAEMVQAQILKPDGAVGLLDDFLSLETEGFDPSRVDPRIKDFYEKTSSYSLWVTAEPNKSTWVRPIAEFVARRLRRARAIALPPDLGKDVFTPLESSIELIDLDRDRHPDVRAWIRVARVAGVPMIVGA